MSLIPPRLAALSAGHRATWMLCTLVALASPAHAAPAVLSMDQAVRLAVARAPVLDARRAQVAAASEDLARAGALPDPMLMVGVDNLPVTGPDAFDPGAESMTMKRIGIRQDVPARAERRARRALAARTVEQAHAAALAERLAVQREAAEAWVGLWTAQQLVAALDELRAQAALASRLARARVEGGVGSASTALAVEAEVLAVEQRLEEARADLAAAQAGMARWIDAPDAHAGPVPPDFSVLPVPAPALIAALDRAGPLLAVEAATWKTAAAIDVAHAGASPDWQIGASYGQRDGSRSDMLMIEFGIQLPLFQRGRQDRDVAARRADHQGALAERDDARRALETSVRAAIARWRGLVRQVERDHGELLPLQRDRSAVALAAFRAGAPADAWLQARRDEIDTLFAHVRRQGELGRLWASLAYLVPAEDTP